MTKIRNLLYLENREDLWQNICIKYYVKQIWEEGVYGGETSGDGDTSLFWHFYWNTGHLTGVCYS